ncbi:hypothetical protein DBR11_24625, partial [Pedobacter sp. HMWF019]|uniref:hypothetical protein n=1 Tax=Pedobacter sp. HMWF019 TaxID=2056856 RepID=UPI000D49FED7
MKYLKIRHYISVLLSEGTRWEFEDILNGGVNLTDRQIKRYSWRKRYLLFVPVMILVLILKKGINSECIGYAIAALSIFIGLFASLIITMYGRYLQIPRLPPTANNDQKIEDKKVRNFIRQFTFVTGKNLLVATVIIALMSLILILPEYMSINVFESKFISSNN